MLRHTFLLPSRQTASSSTSRQQRRQDHLIKTADPTADCPNHLIKCRQQQQRDQDRDQDRDQQRQQQGSDTTFDAPPPSRSFSGGQKIKYFLDRFEKKIPEERLEWLPIFVGPAYRQRVEDLIDGHTTWSAAKASLLRYYGAFNQARQAGLPSRLRQHEARRPNKPKNTINWLERHTSFCRQIDPGTGTNDSTRHSLGLFSALPQDIRQMLLEDLSRDPRSTPYGLLFSRAYFFASLLLRDEEVSRRRETADATGAEE
ncbi:hypothetical protein CP532_1012 [Ophiocordyceps camponoti-leonardi (nom. inval.)]|nr:hypothetical protein CP532_1012 [Ophiocordyceps camponoti-leonardi (nom. inval.)]